jgi:multidrug efflux pump subunit AcrA (membrane-fusion protein)
MPRVSIRNVRRRWWAVALVLVVAIGGTGTWLMLRGDDDSTQRITTTVAKGTLKTTVSADGTISPSRESSLSFTSAGTITSVRVEAGDKVYKGQILARIDDTVLVAQRTAAASSLTAAKTQAASDSSESASQRAANDAAVVSAQAQYQAAAQAASDAALKAPFSGTISSVGISVGDSVGTSSGGGAGASMGGITNTASTSSSSGSIDIISTKKLLIDATVSASDVSQIKAGMQAEITPTGGSETAYGVVRTVGVIASASSSGAATFPVTIEVTGQHTGLYAGASASVSIVVKQADDVLSVATQAVRSSGDDAYVYVISGDKRVKKKITLGTTYGSQTEVTSGLKEGDIVELISFQRPSGSGSGGGDGNLPSMPSGGMPSGMPNFPGGGSGMPQGLGQ